MTADATPFPPRYRWLKRGVCIGVCVLLGLSALRWWWGWEAQRRIDALVADAHAHGEPILPEDFPMPPAVPDSENAAVTYLKAAAAVKMTAPETRWEARSEEPYSAADFAVMRQIEADNSAALLLARTARGQNRVNWGAQFSPSSPPSNAPFPWPLRHLARVLSYSACGEIAAGHDIQGIELLRDALAEARAINAQPTWLIPSLVGIGIGGAGGDAAISFSPSIGNRPTGGAPSSVAASMRGLIGDLLDEDHLSDRIATGLNGEACNVLVEQSNNGNLLPNPLPQPFAWLLQPMFAICRSEVVSRLLASAGATRSANRPGANALLSALSRSFRGGASTLEGFSQLTDIVQDADLSAHLVINRYRTVSDRRAAAIMLALRLYQFDHGDALPEKLSALIPQYLPSLPADPMRADGGTFCYHPHADPPILYSVGVNGIDDGGSSAVIPGTQPGYRWKYLDAVYQLTPNQPLAPATAPSTQAQNNN